MGTLRLLNNINFTENTALIGAGISSSCGTIQSIQNNIFNSNKYIPDVTSVNRLLSYGGAASLRSKHSITSSQFTKNSAYYGGALHVAYVNNEYESIINNNCRGWWFNIYDKNK